MYPEIIFENDGFIVLTKPNGLVVHPFDYSDEYTLLDFLQEKFPEIFQIKNEKILQDGRVINLGGIVHKLDRETSGIMVVAKNQETFDELSFLFKNHQVKKTYIAKVNGVISEEGFVINAPLARAKKSFRQEVNPENKRGELREAITEVKVLRKGDKDTFVLLAPKTGRTHQLRVHMSYIGHSIIGDKIYGLPAQAGNKKDDHERLMLHAKSLEFFLDNKNYFFETETPKEFK